MEIDHICKKVKFSNGTELEKTSPIERAILEKLSDGEILSREFFFENMARKSYRDVLGQSLDVHINRLRKKLFSIGFPGYDIILSARKTGYKWNLELENKICKGV
jgi:DNA-binding response OmpR family regulator